MKRELIPSPAFTRAARRYVKKNASAAADIRAALTLLEADAFDPRLRLTSSKALIQVAGLRARGTIYGSCSSLCSKTAPRKSSC